MSQCVNVRHHPLLSPPWVIVPLPAHTQRTNQSQGRHPSKLQVVAGPRRPGLLCARGREVHSLQGHGRGPCSSGPGGHVCPAVREWRAGGCSVGGPPPPPPPHSPPPTPTRQWRCVAHAHAYGVHATPCLSRILRPRPGRISLPTTRPITHTRTRTPSYAHTHTYAHTSTCCQVDHQRIRKGMALTVENAKPAAVDDFEADVLLLQTRGSPVKVR
jgi:hypothetical protein